MLHPAAGRRRLGTRRGRLQDRRLPPAVDDRRHARSRRSRPASTSSNAELQPILGTGSAHRRWRSRAPTPAAPRTAAPARSLIGNVVTDAMRIDLRGRLRADQLRRPPRRPDLPGRGRPGDFCPVGDAGERDHPRPGAGRAALRQRRRARSRSRGAELKAMLENGVAAMPEPAGALPAGLRALLHLRHHRRAGQPGHRASSARPTTAPAAARRSTLTDADRPTRWRRTTSSPPAATATRTPPTAARPAT